MKEKKPYSITELEELALTPEQILSGAFDDEIRQRMMEVIGNESPIQEDLLEKRVLNSLSLQKLGSRLEPHFAALLEALPARKTEEAGRTIYWRDDAEADYFRPCTSEMRYSYQIPPSEALNAIIQVLENENRKLPKNELLALFASNMEYQRKGSQVTALFLDALELGVASGAIKMTKNYRYYI